MTVQIVPTLLAAMILCGACVTPPNPPQECSLEEGSWEVESVFGGVSGTLIMVEQMMTRGEYVASMFVLRLYGDDRPEDVITGTYARHRHDPLKVIASLDMSGQGVPSVFEMSYSPEDGDCDVGMLSLPSKVSIFDISYFDVRRVKLLLPTASL